MVHVSCFPGCCTRLRLSLLKEGVIGVDDRPNSLFWDLTITSGILRSSGAEMRARPRAACCALFRPRAASERQAEKDEGHHARLQGRDYYRTPRTTLKDLAEQLTS